ncbi:MAG: DoxX family protein [Chthoniobacter sp.]|nr:DoxX family protein [Chthoniobacter sp.]
MWSALKNYSDSVLLIVRVSLGAIILWLHGWPKLAGGIGAWKSYAIKELHISFWPVFWGFLATFAQTVGCTLLILGLFFRPSALLLTLLMLFVAAADYTAGGVGRAAHAIELFLFFLCLLFVGPGRFSFDKG